MNEHEVELIDYLRVLWWGKWIVIACFVIAIGLSAAYTFVQPTTYSGSTELLLREYVTAALADDREVTKAVDSAVSASLAAVMRTHPQIKASAADGHIVLMGSSTESSDAVLRSLAQAATLLGQQLPAELAVEFQHLTTEKQLQERSLVAQRELLQQRLADTQAVEALAVHVAELDAEIARIQATLQVLGTADPQDLLAISTVGESTVRTSRTNFKTTVAIGGFLGLMLGILLAFFVHYLIQVRIRERKQA